MLLHRNEKWFCLQNTQLQYTPDNSNLQGTDENGSSERRFEFSGVNYEEVLVLGDSILVRVIASSSYRGFGVIGGSSYRDYPVLRCSVL